MDTFQMISEIHRVGLLSCMLGIYTVAVFLFIQQIYNRNTGIGSVLLLVWLAVWTTELILLFAENVMLQRQEPGNPAVGGMPVWIIWAIVIVSTLWIFNMIWHSRRREQLQVSVRSIREGIDNLPVALAFFRENGQVALANRRMYQISNELTGSTVISEQELYRILEGKLSQIQGIELTELDRPTLELADGSIWGVTGEQIRLQNESYDQVNLLDITKFCQLYRQLEAEQQELLKRKDRIEELSERIEEMKHEEAVLNSKIRIHNDMGKAALSTRLLLQKKSLTKEEILNGAEVWEEVIGCLGENDRLQWLTGQNANDRQMLDEIIESARKLGCRVVLKEDGEMSRKQAGILRMVLREAIINAIRHAGASEVYVDIINEKKQWILQITDNGKSTPSELKEGGGLTGIRQRVEASGGEVEIRLEPQFKLVVWLSNIDIDQKEISAEKDGGKRKEEQDVSDFIGR